MSTFLKLLAILGGLNLGALPIPAQTYTSTVFFDSSPSNYTLESPLLQASDGNFYGAAEMNGGAQVIYRLSPGGTFTPFFTLPPLAEITTLIQGIDGSLIGASSWIPNEIDSNAQGGTIFSLTLDGKYKTLYTVPSTSEPFLFAYSITQDSTGRLFLVTSSDAEYSGTGLYVLYPQTGALTEIQNFKGKFLANAPVIQATDGNLYGSGAFYEYGLNPSIYAVSPAGYRTEIEASQPTVPYNFISSLTEGPDGYLYGIAQYPFNTNSPDLPGTYVYKVNFSGTSASPVASLPAVQFFVYDQMFGPDQMLYGTSIDYVNDDSYVYNFYTVDPKSGTAQVLTSTPVNSFLAGNVIQASDGAFYAVWSGSQIVRMGAPAGHASPLPAPVQISLSPAKIKPGGSSTLSWSTPAGFSDTARLCFASGNWNGVVPYSGSQNVTVDAEGDYAFSLTCGGNQTSSAMLTVTSGQAASRTAFAASSSNGSVGSPAELSVTVQPETGSGPVPTGKVVFQSSGQTFLTLPLIDGALQQSFTTASFPPGVSSLTAVYSGDANYAPSKGTAAITLTAVPALTFTSSPIPAAQNQPVTFKVTVGSVNGGVTPTGTVSFNGVSVPLSGGVATYKTTAAAPTAASEAVSYSGDARYSATSHNFGYSVLLLSQVSLSLSPAEVVSGQSVTANVSVDSDQGVAVEGYATGQVNFYVGSTLIGSTMLSGGEASFTKSTVGVPPGSYPVVAKYMGDSSYGAATSAAQVETISAH